LHNNPNDKPYGKTYKKPITACGQSVSEPRNHM
jgi:hypothetical protein